MSNDMRALLCGVAGAILGGVASIAGPIACGILVARMHPEDPSAGGAFAFVPCCTLPLGLGLGMLVGVRYYQNHFKKEEPRGFDVVDPSRDRSADRRRS
jgi:hypothetical protein